MNYYSNYKIGDVIIREKGGLLSKHYGIVHSIKNGAVFIAENQVGFGVRVVPLKIFLAQKKIVRVEQNNLNFSQQKTLQRRVSSKFGTKYNLAFYNCEHFVNDVLYGKSKSLQVNNSLAFAGLALGLFLLKD